MTASTAAAPTTPATPSTVATSAPAAPPSTVPAPVRTTPPSAPAGPTAAPVSCQQLAVSAGQQDAGLGHVGVAVVFRNTGSLTCVLTGYPTVSGLDAAGRPLAQAQRTLTGYLGGEVRGAPASAVPLAPGQSAAALVEGLNRAPDGGSACPPYAELSVAAPGQTRTHTLAVAFGACSDLQVHPVLAGSTGTAG